MQNEMPSVYRNVTVRGPESPLLWYTWIYEFIYRYGKVLTQAKTNNLSPATQIPFEIKLAMPKPDRGGRGYSDKLVARLQNELSH